MKARVLSDTWKSTLSKGDTVTDGDYPVYVLIRANDSGYIIIQSDDKPTMENTKKEIELYLDARGIPYGEYQTKSELIEVIDNVGEVEGRSGETDYGESQ